MTHPPDTPTAASPTPYRRLRSEPEALGAGRLGALAGLAGAVSYVIGALLPGSPPKPDADASVVLAYFVQQRGALLAGFGLELIALGLLLLFLGELRSAVTRVGPGAVPLATAMTAAWVVLLTMAAVASLPALALIWDGATATDPAIVRLAYDIENLGTYAAASTVGMVSIGIPSLVIWRYRVLPRWLGALGAFEVAANVVEFSGLWSQHGFLAGGNAGGVGALLFMLWVAAVSVTMVRSRMTTEREAPCAQT